MARYLVVRSVLFNSQRQDSFKQGWEESEREGETGKQISPISISLKSYLFSG